MDYYIHPKVSICHVSMSGQGFDTLILKLEILRSQLKHLGPNRVEKSEMLQPFLLHRSRQRDSVKTQTTTIHEYQGEIEPTIVDEVTSGISTTWDESIEKDTQSSCRAKLFDQMSHFVEDSFLFERFNETRERLLRLLESRQNSAVAGQVRDLTQKLVDIIEEGQRSVSPQLFDIQDADQN
ncbi:hypothetical protein Leryth_011253 [Lithospermum erythrorhizon]|nr:hypothetical protein Leryth_011253 [Lithospermum erythrorhizon]